MNDETYALAGYALYTAGITVTILAVARMIFRHSRIFILKGYEGDAVTATSATSLLRTQFNLTALAVMALLMRFSREGAETLFPVASPHSGSELFEALSVKFGVMLLFIGVMHFLTLRLINRIRTHGEIF